MTPADILHLDFGGEERERRYTLSLGGSEFSVRDVGLERDLRKAAQVLAEAPEQRIALSGLTLQYCFMGKEYRHKRLSKLLAPSLHGRELSDGSLVKRTLERYLVDEAVRQLAVNFREERTLVLSAIPRYGAAEVLSSRTDRIVFGDLLYGFRLGVPLTSIAALRKAAPALLRAVVSTPVSWFDPGARIFSRRMPRFRWYFYWAEVLLGGIQHLRRYSPPKLSGKIVFTNFASDEDLEFLRTRDVATAVGLLPRIGERRVSTGLLEIMLRQLLRGKDAEGEWEAAFLNFFARHRFAPEIENFHAEPDVEPALIDLSATADLPGPKPAPAEEYEAAPADDADKEGRFAFVVHPLVYGQLKQHPVLRSLDRMMPSAWLEELAPVVVPAPIIGTIKDIVSATGARARGYIYGIPMTPKMMLKYPPERTYRRIIQITRHAERLGAGIVGLGAFTSVVGDAGVTVARRSRIGITTGNSFTVAVTIRTLAQAADMMGIELNRASACVIGATGSIGSIICHLLASEVRALTLVSPRPERLLGLSNSLRERFPDIELDITRAPDEALGRADIVVTTTSAVGSVVKMPLLKPGAVVSDVARPPDISPQAAAERPDVLVIESGEVQLFPGAKLTADLGLPEGVIYACLAETILLALEKHYDHFTLGREISEERVRHISELADKHKMKLAAIRSFGKELSDEDILAVRQRAEDARSALSRGA